MPNFHIFADIHAPTNDGIEGEAYAAGIAAEAAVYRQYMKEEVLPLLRPATRVEYATWLEKTLRLNSASYLNFVDQPMPEGSIYFTSKRLYLVPMTAADALTIIVPNRRVLADSDIWNFCGQTRILCLEGDGYNELSASVYNDIQVKTPSLQRVLDSLRAIASLEREKKEILAS